MARETFTPPPPGCNRGAAQRSFCKGFRRSTDVVTSSAGLRVTVRTGSILIPAQMDIDDPVQQLNRLRARALEGVAADYRAVAAAAMNRQHFGENVTVCSRCAAGEYHEFSPVERCLYHMCD